MSDPRANITRTVIAPTAPPPAPPSQPSTRPPASLSEGRLIGKRHGNMRSVGLTLSRPASDAIYRIVEERAITLGEALVEAVQRFTTHSSLGRRLGAAIGSGRGPRMRRGLETRTVYVLLTPPEARWISNLAAERNCTVSDLASQGLAIAEPEQPLMSNDSGEAVG